jgi:peptidoglycan-N-acetylglucosamine deacetylase
MATNPSPDAPAALALTFDNLGEAASFERGEWPADRSLGRHPSVVTVLPRLLDALDAHGLRATFFVEAVNCERYPDALREIAARGHELGHHSWGHERWGTLAPDREAALLTRGMEAFAALGLDVRGFRPPGGELTARSPALLRAAGIRWCSPAGDEVVVRDGLAFVPFRWPLVDAFHVMEQFAGLRERLGVPRAPATPAEMGRRLDAALEALARDGGRRALVLHPFLAAEPAGMAELMRLVGRVAALRRDGVWVGPGRALAERAGSGGA